MRVRQLEGREAELLQRLERRPRRELRPEDLRRAEGMLQGMREEREAALADYEAKQLGTVQATAVAAVEALHAAVEGARTGTPARSWALERHTTDSSIVTSGSGIFELRPPSPSAALLPVLQERVAAANDGLAAAARAVQRGNAAAVEALRAELAAAEAESHPAVVRETQRVARLKELEAQKQRVQREGLVDVAALEARHAALTAEIADAEEAVRVLDVSVNELAVQEAKARAAVVEATRQRAEDAQKRKELAGWNTSKNQGRKRELDEQAQAATQKLAQAEAHAQEHARQSLRELDAANHALMQRQRRLEAARAELPAVVRQTHDVRVATDGVLQRCDRETAELEEQAPHGPPMDARIVRLHELRVAAEQQQAEVERLMERAAALRREVGQALGAGDPAVRERALREYLREVMAALKRLEGLRAECPPMVRRTPRRLLREPLLPLMQAAPSEDTGTQTAAWAPDTWPGASAADWARWRAARQAGPGAATAGRANIRRGDRDALPPAVVAAPVCLATTSRPGTSTMDPRGEERAPEPPLETVFPFAFEGFEELCDDTDALEPASPLAASRDPSRDSDALGQDLDEQDARLRAWAGRLAERARRLQTTADGPPAGDAVERGDPGSGPATDAGAPRPLAQADRRHALRDLYWMQTAVVRLQRLMLDRRQRALHESAARVEGAEDALEKRFDKVHKQFLQLRRAGAPGLDDPGLPPPGGSARRASLASSASSDQSSPPSSPLVGIYTRKMRQLDRQLEGLREQLRSGATPPSADSWSPALKAMPRSLINDRFQRMVGYQV